VVIQEGVVLRSLDGRKVRSNPKLDVIAISDLPSSDRASIARTAGQDAWAVLRDRDTHAYCTALDHETAAVVLALAVPRDAAGLTDRFSPGRRDRVLARLVCDQVLQVEGLDGFFSDGIQAYDVLFDPTAAKHTPVGRLDHLSSLGLTHAIVHPTHSAVALARRLYAFNATPRNQQWDDLLADRDACARWLGISPRVKWSNRLMARYVEHSQAGGDTPWRQWTRHGATPSASVRHKIYVSAATSQLPEVLPVVADVCSSLDVPAFKVGATLLGVLRPDKLVVYVKNEGELWRVVDELLRVLADFEPQGVPFTAPIDGHGLLSWAIDPIGGSLLRPLDEAWSWRSAVSGQLGDSIARAKGCGRDAVIEDFALARLRLSGIEPIGWRAAEEW